MKRAIHISISFLLILATTGVSMSKHICMDRLMDVSLGNKTEACCPFMEAAEDDCCENEVIAFEIDNEFQKIDHQTIDETKWDLISEIQFNDFLLAQALENTPHYFPYPNGPPISSVDLFILNCTYLL
ncbi:hypothetical protein ACFCT7_02470 [Fulvivirgaceae bacterium LMO-SS25]